MTYPQRGFCISFVIHSALLFMVLVMNNSIVSFSKPVVIDFSIEHSSAIKSHEISPAPTSTEVNIKRAKIEPQSVVAGQAAISQKTVRLAVTATNETSPESQAPVVAEPLPASIRPAVESSSPMSSITTAEGKAPPAYEQGSTPADMKTVYLKEHFAYIRNIIQKKLHYPKLARQMGWEGTVIVSFVICTDGCAKGISIREGSGIALLDGNAVSAVRNASPFPKPPVEAQLIIPINYSLQP